MLDSISAEEFISKITKGESVKNSVVRGDVLIKNINNIKQTNWSNCRFDASLEITDCVIDATECSKNETAKKNKFEQSIKQNDVIYQAICLKSSTINGCLIISDCKIINNKKSNIASYKNPKVGDEITTKVKNETNNISEFNFKHLIVQKQIEINNVTIDNDLTAKVKDKNKISAIFRINLESSKITSLKIETHDHQSLHHVIAEGILATESIQIVGNFNYINFDASQIQQNLLIELDGSEIGNVIKLVRTRIKGDFACMASENHNEITRKFHNNELESDSDSNTNYQDVNIANALFYKTKIEGDCYIGFNKYFSNDLKGEKLKFNSLSILYCEILGEVKIADIHVYFNGNTNVFENMNYAAICVNKTFAKSSSFETIKIESKSVDSLTGLSLQSSEIAQIELKKIEIVFSQIPSDAFDTSSVIAIDAANLLCKSLSIVDLKSMRINNSESEKPIFNFDSASIDLLNIKQKSCNLIQSASIGTWKLDPPNETAENYIEMLDNSNMIKQLDLNQCIRIEKHLDNIGKRAEADILHLYWRRKAQEIFRSTDKFKYFISLSWDKSIKFGLSPLRPLFVLFPAIIISSILFSYYYGSWVRISSETLSTLNQCGDDCMQYKNEMIADSKAPKNQLINSILLSVSSSTPIIDIGTVKHLEPVPKTPGYWLILLLKILGWVVWPLFLTGVVPLILPKRQ